MNAFIAAVVKRSNSRNCDGSRRGDERIRIFFSDDLLGAFFVCAVQVGEEKANRDRFNAVVAQRSDRFAHLVFGQRAITSPLGGASRSVTTLRKRRWTSGRSCHGISCPIE